MTHGKASVARITTILARSLTIAIQNHIPSRTWTSQSLGFSVSFGFRHGSWAYKTHGKRCHAVNARILIIVLLQICESLQSSEWKVEHPNPNAMGPYAYKGNQWVGYDDIDIVKLKVRSCYLEMWDMFRIWGSLAWKYETFIISFLCSLASI